VVLADLGLAKRLAEASGLTQAAGTPSYMAPEQSRGDGGFDERADIYAVGGVTYALIAGRTPFPAGSVADVLGRDPDLRPPSLASRLYGVPGALDDILARALAYDPRDRWPTALVLAEHLEAEAYRLEAEAIRTESAPPPNADAERTEVVEVSPPREPEYRRPHRLLTALLLLVAFVAAGAASWYFLGQ
jgi:eukaryotic-like serine/threonine-protein kinase